VVVERNVRVLSHQMTSSPAVRSSPDTHMVIDADSELVRGPFSTMPRQARAVRRVTSSATSCLSSVCLDPIVFQFLLYYTQ
jgi:hypothetical protein